MILTGAVPSTPDARDHDYAFHRSELYAGSAMPGRESVDVLDLHEWRVQGSSSCVAYDIVQKAQALARAQGEPLPLLSAEWVYGGARILAAAPVPGIGIPDTGSSCRLGLKWGRDRGIVGEGVYPDASENHPRVPPARVWQDGGLIKIGACRRIMGEGDVDALRTGIVAALKLAREGKCSPPGSVIPVDAAYTSLAENDVYAEKGGNPLGFHAQTIFIYDAVRDAVGVASTWGGQRVFWISLAWLAKYGFEFWIIEAINRLPRNA